MLQQDALSWEKALNPYFFYPFSAQFCARCLQFFESVIQKNASSSSKAHGGNSFFFFFHPFMLVQKCPEHSVVWLGKSNCVLRKCQQSCKKLLVCSLKNATDLMKNFLTQAKGVNDSIKFICNSSGKQMVGQPLYQPTTVVGRETFPLLICRAKWVIWATYSSLSFSITSTITEDGDGNHMGT